VPHDFLSTLAATLGLGFLSGFRLYLMMAAAGLALRLDLVHLPAGLAGLSILSETWVIAAAAALCTVEFVADKIPWLDSAWDGVHTLIRPIAAVALTTTALGDLAASTKVVLVLLAGSVALTTHSAKAATRLAVNHSPEPFSNIALSLGEDIAAAVAMYLIWNHPFAFLITVSLLMAFMVWLLRKLWRFVRKLFDRSAPRAAPTAGIN
jgi:hypothetical protein